jgi:hypothetical protein
MWEAQIGESQSRPTKPQMIPCLTYNQHERIAGVAQMVECKWKALNSTLGPTRKKKKNPENDGIVETLILLSYFS